MLSTAKLSIDLINKGLISDFEAEQINNKEFDDIYSLIAFLEFDLELNLELIDLQLL